MSHWSPRLLEPADLVRAATRLLERSFVEEYGDAPWLAISLPPNDEGMTSALLAAHQNDPKTPRAPQAIEFHTQMETAASPGARTEKRPAKGGVAIEDLTRLLGDRCFFGAVCKRLDGGGALGQRVSVGRAMNKDIVLRHSSISKFHAYLERDPRDPHAWTVTDAGSTNGTSVEGARLGAKESRRLTSGERVTFGSIQTVLLDARTVYQLLRAA